MGRNLSRMRYCKSTLAILSLAILALTFICNVQVFGDQGRPQVVAIQGLAKVQGHNAVVEILVVVKPGEDAMAKARDKLRRMYPDAKEINSENYLLNGLVWDVIVNNPGNSQVPFVYNNKNVPSGVNPDGSVVMQNAYEAWNNVATSVFQFGFDGNTNKCPSLVKECRGKQSFNGINEIAWLDIRETSVIGVTWFGINIDEFDMALDNVDYNWYDGDPALIPNGAIDLQTVWSHEFGHAAGLGHSDIVGAIMEPYYAGPRRDLHQDDVDGITAIYPDSNIDMPPSVSITSPTDGASFTSGTSISFEGTGTDNEDGDLTAVLAWNSSIDGVLGTGGSFSAVLSDGAHDITAAVTDSNGSAGSGSVNITVFVPGTGDQNDVYVWSIGFSEKWKGKGGSKVDLNTTVIVRRDTDADGNTENTDGLVEGAVVQMTLARDGASFKFSGTTNIEGSVKFTLQHAVVGATYTATVTSVTHSTYNYNNLLNVEDQDSHTIQP